MSCDGDVTIARCGDSRHRVREAELSRVRVERTEDRGVAQIAVRRRTHLRWLERWMDGHGVIISLYAL